MKGDAKIIQYLNQALTNELTAINQYFLHAKMFKNWGFEKLAKHEYEELKEGVWLEPALALLRKKTKGDWTKTVRCWWVE